MFDQMSHPQRGLYWPIYLRRNFLTLHSFILLFFFIVRLMTGYHITYSLVYDLLSVLECKFHKGNDFNNFIHHFISNA